MSKYNWNFTPAEQQANVEATEPKEVEKSLSPVLGQQIAGVVAEGIEAYFKHKGIDQLDRRHLVFPEAAAAKADPEFRFTQRDLQDATPWGELPDSAKNRRKVLMRAFFRNILFGTSLDKSLEEFGDATREVKPLICVRTLSSGTDSQGGYLIPPGFIPYLVKDIPRMSVLFPLVTVWPTGQNNSGTMPTVATNATSSWGSESTTITTGDPTFGEATYTVRRHNTRAVLPLELVNDTNPAIVDTVVRLIQEAMAQERDHVIAYGTGSGRPTGIYQSSGITDVSGITAVNFANLNKLLFSVDMRWHDDPSFRWVFNQNVLNAAASLVDSTGQPIVKFNDLATGAAATLLGKRFVVSNSFPNTFIGCGRVAGYIWFDRQDMGAAQDMSGAYFDDHQMALKVWERCDGKFVNTPTSQFARSKILAGVTSLVTPQGN